MLVKQLVGQPCPHIPSNAVPVATITTHGMTRSSTIRVHAVLPMRECDSQELERMRTKAMKTNNQDVPLWV